MLDKPDLRVGFTPGPCEDAFKAGAAPVLGAQGYRIAYAHFSTGLEVNKAVAYDEVDANVMQHSVYPQARGRAGARGNRRCRRVRRGRLPRRHGRRQDHHA